MTNSSCQPRHLSPLLQGCVLRAVLRRNVPWSCSFELRCTQSCAHRDSVYVSPTWLLPRLEDVTVLDARGRVETREEAPGVEKSEYRTSKDDYLTSHIPGATFWDWQVDGIDASQAVPVQLQLDSDIFAPDAEERGVSADRPVVVYDDGSAGSMFACRTWWSLKTHGHPSVYVLEGGWNAWLASDGPTQLYEPCPLKVMAEFDCQADLRHYADLDGVVQATRKGTRWHQLLDVRSRAQFDGCIRRSKHAGHVPGAISLPFKSVLNETTGKVLEQAELLSVFASAGVSLDAETTIYCNGGVSACVVAAALESAGCTTWQVYDGSWNEYGNRDDVPIQGPRA